MSDIHYSESSQISRTHYNPNVDAKMGSNKTFYLRQ
mgnify:CR=1 FL=1